MKTAESKIQSALNLKSNLQLAVGLGVLLLLTFALFYKSPSSAKSRTLVAQAKNFLEKSDKKGATQALPLLNEAARLTPQTEDVYTARGYAYELLEENEKAAADYSQALTLKPNDAWTHTHYARMLLDIGQTQRALEETKRTILLEPQNDNAHFFQGIAYERLKMYPRALQAFNKAIEITPDAPRMYLARAYLFRAQGNDKRALEDCSQAIGYGSGEVAANAYIVRGNIFRDEKHVQKAIADYNAAIKIDPQNSFGFLNRAVIYGDLEKYPLALEDLNHAIAVDPKNWLAFYNRGYANQYLQKYSLAFSDFNRAIQLNPKHAPSYDNRAQIFMRRKEWRKAINDYTKALALDKENDIARINRGWSNFRLEDAISAERDYSFLIQRKKYLASAYAFRGLARLLQFRDAEAQKDFAMSRRLNETKVAKNADAEWKTLQGYIATVKTRRKKHKVKP